MVLSCYTANRLGTWRRLFDKLIKLNDRQQAGQLPGPDGQPGRVDRYLINSNKDNDYHGEHKI